MSDPRWQQIQDLFQAALERPAAERDAWLDEACGGDVELRAEVASLLEADRAHSPLLDSGGVGDAAQSILSMEGRMVGPYRIAGKLGEGGMGAVYLAERADGQFEQTVALKLLRAGMDSEQILRRFSEERRILARLEHTNIARLLDGGVAENGRPWFAMEYVDGEPLDQWCDGQRLSIEARLELFLTVCDAVRYAHGKLVVHRDLKPDNILVARDDQGRPLVKLLDFGIAKLIEEDREGVTQTSQAPLTPAYASPEQVLGEPVSTVTDVYSLGLVLYGLLTGARPYEVTPGNSREMAEAIVSAQPTRPSSAGDADTLATASQARRIHPERLRRRLAGDLDVITLKALRKEPERRYPSVEALQDDLRRHMEGLPISARPDTLGYRTLKFVSRNRGRLTAAAAMVVALGTTVGFYTAELQDERDRAQVEAETAEEVITFLETLFENANPQEAGRAEVSVREVVDDGAERLRTELDDRPVVRARLLDVMGGAYRALRLDEEAEAVLEQAVADWERAGPDGASGLVESLNKLATVQGQLLRQDDAVATYERALALARQTQGDPSLKVSELLNNLALVVSQQGDYLRMEELLRESIAMEDELLGEGDSPSGAKVFNLAWVTQYNGRYDDAIELYGRAEALLIAEYGEDDARALYPVQAVSDIYADRGQLDTADSLLSRVRDRTLVIYGEESVDYGFVLADLGRIRSDQGRYDEAEAMLRQSIEVVEAAYGQSHPNLASVIETLGLHYLEMEDWERGEAALRRALAMYRETLGSPHPDVSNVTGNLGFLLRRAGRSEEAEELYRRAMAMDVELYGADHREVATSLHNIALIRVDAGDFQAADSLHRDALAMRRRLFGDDHIHVAISLGNMATMEERRGDLDQARSYLEEELAVRIGLADGNEAAEPVVAVRERLEALEGELAGG